MMPGASGSYSSGSCTGSHTMLRPYVIVDVAPKISTTSTNHPYLQASTHDTGVSKLTVTKQSLQC